MNNDKYTFTAAQLRELLYGTIQMFQEYRDVHDHTEEASVFAAVRDMFEGLDAERELLASGDIAKLTLQTIDDVPGDGEVNPWLLTGEELARTDLAAKAGWPL